MRKTMRVVALVLVLVALGLGSVSAQDVSLDDFIGAFEDFAGEVAKSLPMNATIGLNWSDAYIGQFIGIPPRFGVGITAGVTTIPLAAFEDLFDTLGTALPEGLGDLERFGVPLPGYAFDARIGGFILPFDAGVKFGTLSREMDDVAIEYTQFGFDARYAVLKGGLVMPKLSIGAGYSYLSGEIRTAGADPIALGSVPYEVLGQTGDAEVSLTDPALGFQWDANIIDLRAQLSKQLLIIEPSIGLGYSMGRARTTAGFTTDGVAVTATSGPLSGQTLTADDLAALGIDIGDTGATVSQTVSTNAFRVFGGMSLNILILRLDFGAMYNLSSGAMGATIGGRIQL